MLKFSEFLAEISKEKVARYLKRAIPDHSMATGTIPHVDGEEKEKLKHFEKRRRAGISRAVDRGGMDVREESELNELSTAKLAAYASAADEKIKGDYSPGGWRTGYGRAKTPTGKGQNHMNGVRHAIQKLKNRARGIE
jgi:hypothetical protein